MSDVYMLIIIFNQMFIFLSYRETSSVINCDKSNNKTLFLSVEFLFQIMH